MKKSTLLPSASVVLCVVTYFLRKHQISQVKDAQTLLFEPMAMETILLATLVLVGHIALMIGLNSDSRDLPNYKFTVYCPRFSFFAMTSLASLLLLLSVLMGFLDMKSDYDTALKNSNAYVEFSYDFPFFQVCKCMFSLFVAYIMFYLGKNAYEGTTLRKHFLTVFPAFLACWYFMDIYRDYSSLPNLQEKLYPTFAGLSLLHGFYQLAVAAYETPRPILFSFFSLSSVMLLGATLGGPITPYFAMVHCSLVLYLLAFSVAIIENTFCSREDYRTPPKGI